VELNGRSLGELDDRDLREARRRVGLVFQHANLLENRTARKNVEYPLEIARWTERTKRARSQELLDLVGIGSLGDSYPAQLSGGQQQRVGIARALAPHPDVIICDEPTSALDGQTTRGLLELLRRLRDDLGATLLIVTHDLSVVRSIADRVIELRHGRIVRSGTVTEVAADPDSPLLDDLLAADAPNPLGLVVSGAEALARTPFLSELTRDLGDDIVLAAGGTHRIGGHRVFRGELEFADADLRDAAATWLGERGFTAVAR
jgi:D-methionine transport system ATP-binding protein